MSSGGSAVKRLVWVGSVLCALATAVPAQRPTVEVEFCLAVDDWMDGEEFDHESLRNGIAAELARVLPEQLSMFRFIAGPGEAPTFRMHVLVEPASQVTSITKTRFSITLMHDPGDARYPFDEGFAKKRTQADLLALLGVETREECAASKLVAEMPDPQPATHALLPFLPPDQYDGAYRNETQFTQLVTAKLMEQVLAKREELIDALFKPISWGSEAFALVRSKSSFLVLPFSFDEIGAVSKNTDLTAEEDDAAPGSAFTVLQVLIPDPEDDLFEYEYFVGDSGRPWNKVKPLVDAAFLDRHVSVGEKIVGTDVPLMKEQSLVSGLREVIGEEPRTVAVRGIFIRRHFRATAEIGQVGPE